MPSGNNTDPASAIWRSESKFEQWAELIHLDQELKQNLPEELQGLVDASRKFPAWLGDPNADEFKPYDGIFPSQIAGMQTNLPEDMTNVVRDQAGAEATKWLPLALLPILNIPKTYDYLSKVESYGGHMSETDMRTTLDQLLNHVWHNEAAPNFAHLYVPSPVGTKQAYMIFSLERKLQLPKPNSEDATPVTETISDSIVLFWDPEDRFRILFKSGPRRKPALSCLAREHTPAALHWATEYKQDDPLAVSRQTRMAMVSGLYQRRALGFMDHFVFGTAHSGNRLDVFAGRWESVKSPADQATGASPAEEDAPKSQATPDQKDQDTTPPIDRRSTLGSSKKTPSGPTSNLPKKDKYEIKVYQFPGYSLLSPLDMIEFYMLMRASRDLACKYAAEIFSNRYGKAYNLPVENCTWPADPRDSQQRKTSGFNSRANSQHQPGLETIEEKGRDCTDFLSEHYDNGVDEWEANDERHLHLVNKGRPGWLDQLRREPTPEPDQKVLEYLEGLGDKPTDPVV
ncbi:hypothetical protein CTheo_6356 [Ceratobasidium theobromae]|uniref:Uncharacterized protein n=1 Tax=Ceratobasidium theobromae TaxID=1582974 RepID=A0A5N5QF15_9AGAM|nr:hypothetical protein CTheo_6356 [Ceratobasidium theobromae]